MFGIGPMELVVICVIALVFVGPKKLPDMMRQIGKLFVHARRYSSDIRSEFNEVVRKAEVELQKEEMEKLRQKIQSEISKGSAAIEGEVVKAHEAHEAHEPHEAHEGPSAKKASEAEEGHPDASSSLDEHGGHVSGTESYGGADAGKASTGFDDEPEPAKEPKK